MKIKEISFEKLKRLFDSVDDDLEVVSVSFVNDDYVLNFKKSLSNIKYDTNEHLMSELQKLIKKADKAFAKVLSNSENGENP